MGLWTIAVSVNACSVKMSRHNRAWHARTACIGKKLKKRRAFATEKSNQRNKPAAPGTCLSGLEVSGFGEASNPKPGRTLYAAHSMSVVG